MITATATLMVGQTIRVWKRGACEEYEPSIILKVWAIDAYNSYYFKEVQKLGLAFEQYLDKVQFESQYEFKLA